MTPMSQLWLPILLAAVAVFVASSVIHMFLPWHKGDFPRLANEDAVLDALRPLSIPPGDYMMPRPQTREEMRSAAFDERLARGPVLMMTVMPNGPMNMGRSMGGWFIYLLVVNALAAHVAQQLLAPAADHRLVFHTIGLITFAAYALALWQLSIWYRRSWSITIKWTIDGLVYALISAGVFVWCWPK